MKSVIAAWGLALLMAWPARALSVACKTFERSNTHAPQLVRDYLDGSKDLLVRVCGGGDDLHYLGASNPVRDGNVCRYSMYDLNLSHGSLSRLARTATTPHTYMLISQTSACPSPAVIEYAAANNIPRNVFEHLVHAWRAAISSPSSFDWTFSGVSDAAALSRLRDTILQGKSDRLAVVSAETSRHIPPWKSYEIYVADPDHSDRFYVVTVSSWFGRTYGISHIRAGIY